MFTTGSFTLIWMMMVKGTVWWLKDQLAIALAQAKYNKKLREVLGKERKFKNS